MVRKRPCKICRKWFLPNPRAGKRQRTCSDPKCQKERHRRACLDWRNRNPELERENRFRARLELLSESSKKSQKSPLIGKLNSQVIRDTVGLEASIIIEEIVRLIQNWARDSVHQQLIEIKGKSSQLPIKVPRDAMVPRQIPP